ncbi:hypothetical protein [Aquimarina aquimarini]|uniref:hypothetical protein n=1 Tax=Aquimarina aquimarini TaxID=1191734 RepID=UPI000D54C3CA|nr:hypothetical protein [Aquimarina aquimarini]
MVLSGTMASLAQVFAEGNPKDIVLAKKEFKKYRSLRDENRSYAVLLLKEIASNSNVITPEKKNKALNLVKEHDLNQKKLSKQYTNLQNRKAYHKIRSFKTLNAFLNGIGLPVFIFMIGFVFTVLYVNNKNINWNEMVKIFPLVALMCFIISMVYITWALSPELDIDPSSYITGLIVVSIVSVFFIRRIIANLFKINLDGFTMKEGVKKLFEMQLNNKKNKNQ